MMSAPGALGPSGAACSLAPDAAGSYPAVLADNNGLVTHEQNQAMADLVTYAASCDLTRVFLFQHGRPAAHYNMKVIGINTNIHDDISHGEGGDQPTMNRAMLYWMDQFRSTDSETNASMAARKNTPAVCRTYFCLRAFFIRPPSPWSSRPRWPGSGRSRAC